MSKISTFPPFQVGEAPFSQKGQKFVFYDTHIDLLYKYFLLILALFANFKAKCAQNA